MLPFSYEDRFPNAMTMGYAATNEEPTVIRDLIKNKFKNGLGIASAGEVTFLALLPKTEDSLVLVDHSYKSLRVFCLKALLLATIGPTATRRLLIADKMVGLKEALVKVEPFLPVSLQPNGRWWMTDLIQSAPTDIRREWYYSDLTSLRKTVKSLHKIKLIHGDLTDTADRAPYDFLYLSNALEHTGRGGTYPNAIVLSKSLLKKDGAVVWVEAAGGRGVGNGVAYRDWELKAKVPGYRTTWKYNLSTPKNETYYTSAPASL